MVAFFGLLPACTLDAESNWIDVTCGGGHACALAEDGTVKCWGKASDGQTNPPADTKFVQISAGDTHTCGITDDGEVACWGSNHDLESIGRTGSYLAVSAGQGFTCAVTSTRQVDCWGTFPDFQEDDQGNPQPPTNLVAIDAGESHVCAITDSERTVACWGAEPAKRSKTETGSLDTDTTDETPAIVGALEIGAGRTHSCALIEDGTVACWGMGQDNQAVGQDGPFVHLAVGAQHNCALDDAGVVSCWGDNGDDESDPPEGGGPYDRISAGDEFTCAVDRDGHIVCWGNNDLDQSHPPG